MVVNNIIREPKHDAFQSQHLHLKKEIYEEKSRREEKMQTDNLTGSVISLITNAQVRYEGTLVEINRAERSMNLSDVRSFGTEGRRDGKNEIQGHENVISSVIFKVDHVKDFTIIKRPEAKAP